MKLQQKVYKLVPPGRYDAELVDVEVNESNFGDGGQYLKLTFKLDDPEYQDVNVAAFANALFSTRSKLYRWAKALFGKPIPTSYTLDTADLLHKRCELGIEVVQKGDDEFNSVESIYPIRERRAAQAPDPAMPTPDDAAWPEQPPVGLEEEPEKIPF